MTTYRKVAELSEIDAAYIAGLIDGEGTVTLTRKHRNENRQALILLKQISPYLKTYKSDRSAVILRDYTASIKKRY